MTQILRIQQMTLDIRSDGEKGVAYSFVRIVRKHISPRERSFGDASSCPESSKSLT